MNRRLIAVMGLGLCLVLGGCDKSQSQTPPAPPPTPADPGAGTLTTPAPPSPAPGQQPTAPTPMPVSANGPAWFCDPSTIGFGEVWAGEIVTRSFEFRNVGTQTLKILETKGRCSCSVADNYTKEVPPGGSGTIPFKLNTNGKYGPVNEWLDIKTNDPGRPMMKITLTGHVKQVCDMEVTYDLIHEKAKAKMPTLPMPAKARGSFGRIKSNDELRRVIKMTNTSGSPLTLTMGPIIGSSQFTAEVKEIVPNQQWELTVVGKGPWPLGYSQATINFKTNIPEQPNFPVGLFAQVPPRVEVLPTKVVIDPQYGHTPERHVKVMNNGPTPFEIVSIACSEAAFNLRLDPVDPAKPAERTIKMTMPSAAYRVPEHGEVIEIKTSDPEVPLLRLDVLPSTARPAAPRPVDKPLQLHPGRMPEGEGSRLVAPRP